MQALRGLSVAKLTQQDFKVVLRQSKTVFGEASTELKQGEEVELAVEVGGVPPNIDVKEVSATITVSPQAANPDPNDSFKQSATITQEGASTKFTISVPPVGAPSSLSLRLVGGEVFWSLGKPKISGEFDVPDFASEANAYLERLEKKDNSLSLNFSVKSDAPGTIELRVVDLVYSVIQTQSWDNPNDQSHRVDRTFELGFGSVELVRLDALGAIMSKPHRLSAVSLDIAGEFDEERLITCVREFRGNEYASINPDYTVAQQIVFPSDFRPFVKPINVVGAACLFQVESESNVYLELQGENAGGLPETGQPLAKSNLTIAPNKDALTAQLTYAQFETPCSLELARRYWLVVKGVQGETTIALRSAAEESYLAQCLANRSGRNWRALGNTGQAVMLHLVIVPEPDTQVSAVEVGLAGAASFQRIVPGQSPQPVSLGIPENLATPVTLIIRSYGQGTFSIANVVQEFVPTSDNVGKLFWNEPAWKIRQVSMQ